MEQQPRGKVHLERIDYLRKYPFIVSLPSLKAPEVPQEIQPLSFFFEEQLVSLP